MACGEPAEKNNRLFIRFHFELRLSPVVYGYPHKPAVVVPAPQQTKDTEKAQDTTDFKQPSDNFSGQDETAPTPAGSGGLNLAAITNQGIHCAFF